jgi:NAD(P)-dependent dehydrogenase (short-subunit alcohol dehydrogenase family)
MLLENKIALVTGGVQGVGLAIAKALSKEGASIIIVDVKANEKVKSLFADGADVTVHAVDVTDEAQVVKLFDSVPKLDILVNNVGTYGPVKKIVEMDRSEWDRTFAINLTSTMLCSREAVKKMQAARSGNILNIASNVARRGLPYRGCYVATKWAMLGFNQTLALETVEYGIRVNAILPGPVETPHLHEVMQLHAQIEGKNIADVAEEWRNGAPMKRFIEPEEIGDVAVFLTSNMSSAMTGQSLNVTCGFIMT